MADIVCGAVWSPCHATLAYAALGGTGLLVAAIAMVAISNR